MDWKDICKRAAKTFIQAFIPVIIASMSLVDVTDLSASKSVIYSALISAVSAGISAVWNVIVQAVNVNKEVETKEDEQAGSLE